ncbi:hypothetical protein B0T22DRAFT_380909 [Podospora appendiculata]|uniref:Kelch domain-containing protein n=1 Tax=Podospora appendiculata TaxID=314037 RepID=A0AAE0X5T3_9PEZI|nr:hypothetical protein B0T22DRAFT_380909 [Podospora appendiculata]
MDSFKQLKRRTTDLLQSLPHSLPSIPSLGGHGHGLNHGKSNHHATMKGTWEKISVPPLPRSSHSINIVAGTVYIFGGQADPSKTPADNDMHVVTLPSSGAQADYHAIKAKAIKRTIPTINEVKPSPEPEAETELVGAAAQDLADVSLDTPIEAPVDKGKSKALPDFNLGDVPAPRAGHATAVIGHRIFLFGGHAGGSLETSTPLNEGGRVWVFDTRTNLWSFIDPAPVIPPGVSALPAPRSHHAVVATDKPRDFNQAASAHTQSPGATTRAEAWREWARGDSDEVGIPQRPIVGSVAERATDLDDDGYGTLIIHGGRLAGGARAADVWAFDVHSRAWQRLPDAPGGPRSDTTLALSKSRLYRFGGFGGPQAGAEESSDESGQLDFLELAVDRFDDEFSVGEVSITARRSGWQSLIPGKENVGYKEVDAAATPLALENDEEWPGQRGAAGLEAITIGGGREYLVLLLGEKARSRPDDEQGDRFCDDVWAFQVPPQGLSPASLADTFFSAVGRKSGEGQWAKVEMGPFDDEDDASAEGPGARGFIATATMGDLEENGIVVWGGLNVENQGLGDGWILRLG